MSEMGEMYRDIKDWQKARRRIWGEPCAKCRKEQPRRQPTILEPGRICKVHRPWYRDPRPHPTEEEFAERMAAHGWNEAKQ